MRRQKCCDHGAHIGWRGYVFDKETEIVARAVDSSGYTQPSRDELTAARGMNSAYHYNGVKVWKIAADGSVKNA